MQADSPQRLLALNACPDSGTAEKIAAALVEERLAACVQVLPGVRSYFRWEGKADNAAECLLLIKTTAARYPAAERRIRQLHPYELPEIIAVPISVGLPEYLRWVDSCTMKPDAD